MTDLYAEAAAPVLDMRERLDFALASIGDTELSAVIASAGLAAVHDEWQRCRVDLAMQEDVGRALALRIAELTDEARRWKRRWAGAVAQARQEHDYAANAGAAADRELRARVAVAELADQFDALNRRSNGADRIPLDVVADRIRRAIESTVTAVAE